MKQRNVIIVAASPLIGEGLKAALGDDASLHVLAPVRRIDDIDWSNAPDAVVAAADARGAADVHHSLAGRVPLVLLCDAPPPLPWQHAHGDASPLATVRSDASPEQLWAALRAVLAGLHAWSPGIDLDVNTPLAPSGTGDEPSGEPLTPRELEVFEVLAKGLSNRDIAGALGISAHTAKFHVAQILAKIGAATRAEAVAIGLRLGLIGV